MIEEFCSPHQKTINSLKRIQNSIGFRVQNSILLDIHEFSLTLGKARVNLVYRYRCYHLIKYNISHHSAWRLFAL